MSTLPFLFGSARWIGSVSEVTPTSAKVNLPRAGSGSAAWCYGTRMGGGEVGEFVVVECEGHAVLGRIVSVKLPEKERWAVERGFGESGDFHPIGTVQLLTSISLATGEVLIGVSEYPRLGGRVFSAHPDLLKHIAENGSKQTARKGKLAFHLAGASMSTTVPIHITPERLFGRHCAVLGATGGGKSWTLSRIIEQVAVHRGKLLLLDATGEFRSLQDRVRHVVLGGGSNDHARGVSIPHSDLRESDLFALFRPSGQTQAPKLRAAIRSLRLDRLSDGRLGVEGVVVKAEQSKATFSRFEREYADELERSDANFDITKLAQQVDAECVFQTPFGGNAGSWGKVAEQERAHCVSLIARIEGVLAAPELACVFRPGESQSVFQAIDEFEHDDQAAVLRVDLSELSFAFHAREIVVNAIGRWLLERARRGEFRERPMVIALDEAHQFLSARVADETLSFPLDAFDLIAKEGRKYCLTLCLATQRPRDVPQGVLSQMGTLIVHRLTNSADREVVERASGDIDRSAAAFLPNLAPGEAVIIGGELPLPLTIRVEAPSRPPVSDGPDFQSCWSGEAVAAAVS